MKSFKNFYLESIHSAVYMGNCTNLFDSDTGECSVGGFQDVSDFGAKEESFREEAEENPNLFLSREEFLPLISKPEDLDLKENWEYYFYPGERNIYVAYDPEEDIHYFFWKD
jgi:hypothetical protein